MRIARITGSILAVAAAAGAFVYDANTKVALAPAVTSDGENIYVAFARLDRSLKLGRFTLSNTQAGPQANLEAAANLTSRTNDPFALAWGDGTLFLAWTDYQSGKANVASFAVGSKDKLNFGGTRSTSIKSRGGVSLAYDKNRLYVGYTDATEDLVKVATFKVAGGKLTQESERKLVECATVVGGAVAVSEGTLAVAWVNADKKIIITTYGLEESSKGMNYTFARETRTELKALTEPFVDRPALATAEGEIDLAYVDKTDKTPHVNFYTIQADGFLKSAGETRINVKAGAPVGITALKGGKNYVAVVDTNEALFIADK